MTRITPFGLEVTELYAPVIKKKQSKARDITKIRQKSKFAEYRYNQPALTESKLSHSSKLVKTFTIGKFFRNSN